MKKLFLAFAVFLIGPALTADNASAWYFELENPDMDEVFEIYFDPEGQTLLLENLQLDFRYDLTAMSWTGGYTNTPPPGLYPDFMGPVEEADAYHDPTPGFLRNFNQATMVAGASVSERIPLGTISFDYNEGVDPTNDDRHLGFNQDSLVMKATIDGPPCDYLPGSDHLRYGDGNVGDYGGPPPCLLGDVDADEDVDLNDVMLTLQVAAGLTPANPNLDADVNGDGKIGPEEAIYIPQVVAGLR